MLFTTPRAATAALLAVGLAATGAAARQDAAKTADPPPKQKADEDVVAWSRAVGGLQAGLVLRGGAKKVYRHGDVITLGVRVRNVGKAAVTFGYVRQHLDENRPTVRSDDDGDIR